jgi:hypothetical protein
LPRDAGHARFQFLYQTFGLAFASERAGDFSDVLPDVAEGVGLSPGRESDLLQGFKRIVLAAVGPIVASELESFGVQVSIMPSGGTLVRELAAVLAKDGKAGAA